MLTVERQRGFNLIEAVVTLAVLGILIAAGIPSMSEWIQGTHVRNVAENMQAGLQKARAEAIKQNKIVTFWIVSPTTTARPDDTCALSSASGAWVVSVDDPTGKCATAPSPKDAPRIAEVYGPGNAAAGIVVKAVDSAAADASSVSFNAYGQRVAGGIATIDISHSKGPEIRASRIQVSPSGGIRRCDPVVTVDSPTDPRACS